MRAVLGRLVTALLRRSVEEALETGATTAVSAAADATSKQFRQTFEVKLPTTIYVRASHSAVTVRYGPPDRVEVAAMLRVAFGWELVTEQDEAGLYIVAKRKPMVGRLSAAAFTITVPPQANLVLNLTPGSIYFENIDGKLNVPGLEERTVVGQSSGTS